MPPVTDDLAYTFRRWRNDNPPIPGCDCSQCTGSTAADPPLPPPEPEPAPAPAGDWYVTMRESMPWPSSDPASAPTLNEILSEWDRASTPVPTLIPRASAFNNIMSPVDPATGEDLTPGEASRAYIPRAVRADWRTPENVVEVVRAALGGEIGLDPCASTEHWLAGGEELAVLNMHEEDDGLALDWAKSIQADGAPRTVFVNPPFNRNRDWVKKCAEEAAKGLEVVLLIPARVDTRYWQNVIAETAQAICFWRGRITFVGAESGAPFPCAFVYWGPNGATFDNAFDECGQVLYTNNEVTRSEG